MLLFACFLFFFFFDQVARDVKSVSTVFSESITSNFQDLFLKGPGPHPFKKINNFKLVTLTFKL